MARDSGYSLNCDNGTTTASAIELTSNPLSSSYTKLSYVVQHRADDVTGTKGLFGYWPATENGQILFRITATTLQLYVRSGGSQYGAATSDTAAAGAFEWRGFRIDGSLASGARLAVFSPAGAKGTDAAGPATMDAMSATPKMGYSSASMPGFEGYTRNAFLWVGIALPDSAYEAIANGVHPLVFGPTHWWPMDNTLIDLAGGNPLTNMGANMSHSTAQSTKHIALPSGIIVPHTVAAAAGQTGALLAAAQSASTFGAVAAASAAVTEGAESGDTPGGNASAQAALLAATQAAEIQAALATAQAAITEGVASGEAWTADATALAATLEAALSGATFTGAVTTPGAQTGALTAGATSEEQFLSAAQTIASITSGALASATLTAVTHSVAVLVAGALSGESMAGSTAAVATLSAAALSGDSVAATAAAAASLTGGALAGASFDIAGEIGNLIADIIIQAALGGAILIGKAIDGDVTIN